MKYKKERFQLSDINSKDIVKKLAVANRNYELSSKDFLRKYKCGDKVYECSYRTARPIISDDLQVHMAGILIGSVKKGSSSHVKKLLADPNYSHCEVEIGGGKYKSICFDDNPKVFKGSHGIWAHLSIFIKEPSGFFGKLFSR